MNHPSPDSDAIPPASAPRVPFVIGVTGNMDPEGYHDDRASCDASPQMIKLRQQIEAVFDWLRSGKGSLDPTQGLFRAGSPSSDLSVAFPACWDALGMLNTPILILSSLAPGIDTIVVEAALDYAAKHPKAAITVFAPLPFPADIYHEASSFNTPAKVQRFLELRARLDKSRLFEVALDNDLLRGTPDEAKDDLEGDDPRFSKPRRRLRYRAAGEFIAAHSDLLLAIFDEALDTPHLDDIFEAGSATIVESKRAGLTHELLAVANNFAWADNGPVLVIPVKRRKRQDLAPEKSALLAEPGSMRFLHPYDLRPQGVEGSDDQHPAWQETGDTRFRRVLVRQEKFNLLPRNPREDREPEDMTGPLSDPGARNFAVSFDPIARLRRRASDASVDLGDRRQRLLCWMFGLIFVAANLFGSYEHWHHKDHPHGVHEGQVLPSDFMSWTQVGLLVGTLLCLTACGIAYFRHRKSGREENRFDYRSIGEALRVQFYWKLAGTGRSVAADYMQRQRDELDWIRYVVSSLSMPHETTRKDFLDLPRPSQVALLEATRKRWIGKQIQYFLGSPGEPGAAGKREKLAHRCHGTGWTLAAAGLVSMLLMLASEASLPFEHFLHKDPGGVAAPIFLLGLFLVGFHFVVRQMSKAKGHSPAGHADDAHGEGVVEVSRRTGFLRWVFGNPLTWGCALLLAAVIVASAHGLDSQDGKTHAPAHPAETESPAHAEPKYWPDGHNLWIIFTGAVLLGGAMCVAWAERNFYAEEARQYRAMGHLFSCADRRLEELIKRYEKAPATGATTDRILFEIHDILHQLGCEALDENAEWLIQHRARPLEMLMAG